MRQEAEGLRVVGTLRFEGRPEPLKSVDLNTKAIAEAGWERSDISAISAASVIMENVVAFEIARAFLEKFGGDSMVEIRANYDNYLATAQEGGDGFPAIEDLWDVDEFGGWDALNEKLFSDAGIVTQAQAG